MRNKVSTIKTVRDKLDVFLQNNEKQEHVNVSRKQEFPEATMPLDVVAEIPKKRKRMEAMTTDLQCYRDDVSLEQAAVWTSFTEHWTPDDPAGTLP